jgi:hypothetical protein
MTQPKSNIASTSHQAGFYAGGMGIRFHPGAGTPAA